MVAREALAAPFDLTTLAEDHQATPAPLSALLETDLQAAVSDAWKVTFETGVAGAIPSACCTLIFKRIKAPTLP